MTLLMLASAISSPVKMVSTARFAPSPDDAGTSVVFRSSSVPADANVSAPFRRCSALMTLIAASHASKATLSMVVPPEPVSDHTITQQVIPTALEQFRFDAEKPAISKACGDLIGSD